VGAAWDTVRGVAAEVGPGSGDGPTVGGQQPGADTPPSPPRAVIHIGLEKTGTTYLQNLLRDNAEELARQGVNYPASFGYINHHALAAYAVDASSVQDIHRWNGVTAANQDEFRGALRRRLAAEVASRPARSWLFSCEHLSSRLHTQEAVDRLVELMRACGLDPEVLVLLRPQGEMIPSMFSTAVISGATAAFDVGVSIANRARYDFDAMLRRWEQAFGADRVTVGAYRRNQPPGELAESFCRLAGVDPRGLRLPDSRANASLPFVQAELLRLFNQAAGETPRLMRGVRRTTLVEGLRGLPGYSLRLTAEEEQRIREAYAASNAAVASRYGIDLSDSSAGDGAERPSTFTPDDVSAFLRALANARVKRARPGRRGGAARAVPAPATRTSKPGLRTRLKRLLRGWRQQRGPSSRA